eukprot:CAMPEP_0204284308 /NCGR_PEP_ID=MMETSP0468-20130131/48203_1 /ASSEMBLY_ACC=CAM_ASM_000383 /TAXON_ID=2969 /ORGANISM="Oxyrrhis marina" /LENGTH=52 /DNA_ID=CAMNT_0051262023 /DNA_START=43 /DNA_END=198 /DNA_ORIENTATION=+
MSTRPSRLTDVATAPTTPPPRRILPARASTLGMSLTRRDFLRAARRALAPPA